MESMDSTNSCLQSIFTIASAGYGEGPNSERIIISASKPRDVAKLAGTNTCMTSEETGEMRGLGEAEFGTDGADFSRTVQQCVDRPFDTQRFK